MTKTQILQILTVELPKDQYLLFLIYVNDLCNASNILDHIMFADGTNLFFSHRNISTFFDCKNESYKIGKWFKANRLSLNIKKPNLYFFTKIQLKIIYL